MTNIENQQIKDLREEIQSLNKNLTAQNSKLEMVLNILSGGELDKDNGLISKMKKLEKKQEEVEDDLSTLKNQTESTISILKSKWAGIVYACVGVSAVAALIYYVTSIIHNLK